MKFAFKSDKGKIREDNEDSCNVIAGYSGVPVAFIIADGMGGHSSGEVASAMAVQYISSRILQLREQEDEMKEALSEIIQDANRMIFQDGMENEQHSGMGTTLTLAVVVNNRLIIGHVGDSRMYLLREEKLQCLTKDHTYIEELLQNGSITEAEAISHPKKNIITRALGAADAVEPDMYVYGLNSKDVCLLCTDGLTNMVPEEEMREIIGWHEDPEKICEALIDRANHYGGEDNVTVIVFKLK